MLSRRLLRIKAMQVLYSYIESGADDLKKAEKDLNQSINKSYHLFFYLLNISCELSDFALSKIENAKAKMLPTHEDINPNLRFADNELVKLISKNELVKKYAELYNWNLNPEFIKKLYNQLSDLAPYNQFMNADSVSFEDSKNLFKKIYTELINDNEELSQILEEQSIYWNDELEFWISQIVKLISNSREDYFDIPDMYSEEDDEEFVKLLMRKSVVNHVENEKLISTFTKNWDIERIAVLDVVIMEMALVELTLMPSVPVKVTLNEYIEISKYYSTDKSWAFINGILDKLVPHLKENGKIVKKGKGLLGEKVAQNE